MIRRLARRLRFGERIVRAGEVREGDRLLNLHGWHVATRVRVGPVGVQIMGEPVEAPGSAPELRSWVRYAHYAEPVLVRR